MSNSNKSLSGAGVAALKALLAGPGLPELGPGPRAGVTPLTVLEESSAAAVKAGGIRGERAALARGAVLLWHDHFEESHSISQEIPGRDGSWLHGLLHRREPDYSNAAYWYQRVGQHPAFVELARRAGELVAAAGDGELQRALFHGSSWNARGFIDACEQCAGRPATDARRRVLERIQAAEFAVFLEHVLGGGEGDGG